MITYKKDNGKYLIYNSNLIIIKYIKERGYEKSHDRW